VAEYDFSVKAISLDVADKGKHAERNQEFSDGGGLLLG